MQAYHNVQLSYLEDMLFENLPLEKAKNWHELFLNSITVVADLPLVVSKFIVRILGDSERGCIIHAGTPDSEVAIKSVINLHERKIAGEKVSAEEWELARRAAYDAAVVDFSPDAAYVAVHAAYAASHAAAHAASHAAAYATAAAAAYFTDDVAADAARAIHYEWMVDVLIKELKNAN